MDLYDYQKEVLDELEKGTRKLLVLKARQIGFTTLLVGYMTWLAMFHELATILYVSRREEDAKKVVERLKDDGYAYLPEWMKARMPIMNQRSDFLKFANGSEISSAPPSSEPARGHTASLVVLDEWAFFDKGKVDAETAWRSVMPAVDVQGTLVAMSTANGAGTFYHRQWQAAEAGENGFVPKFFSWRCRPDRDEEWYANTRRENSPSVMAAEYPSTAEEAFVFAGSPVFNPVIVEEQGPILEPRRGFLNDDGEFVDVWKVTGKEEIAPIKMWRPPIPGHVYILGMDTAGAQHGGDPSSIHVLHETGKVVAAWCGDLGTNAIYAAFVRAIAEYYNDAFIIIESNGSGQFIADELEHDKYYNLFYKPRELAGGGTAYRPGFPTTPKSKIELIHEIAIALESGIYSLPCEETKRELSEYQTYSNNKYGAPHGAHDDRVISLGLATIGLKHFSVIPTPESVDSFPSYTANAAIMRAMGRQDDGLGKSAIDRLVQRHMEHTF